MNRKPLYYYADRVILATEEEGNNFVHHTAIVKENDEFATLKENDKVKLEITQSDKDRTANNVVVTEAIPAQIRDFRY